MSCEVKYFDEGKIANLILNNPERRNALNDQMIDEIVKTWKPLI